MKKLLLITVIATQIYSANSMGQRGYPQEINQPKASTDMVSCMSSGHKCSNGGLCLKGKSGLYYCATVKGKPTSELVVN